MELQALLSSIIDSKGVPLSYVIRMENLPPPSIGTYWERKAILIFLHTGIEFDYNKRTVHNIIIRNIAEDSDAYIYPKSTINREDCRNNINVLRDRYENVATM